MYEQVHLDAEYLSLYLDSLYVVLVYEQQSEMQTARSVERGIWAISVTSSPTLGTRKGPSNCS